MAASSSLLALAHATSTGVTAEQKTEEKKPSIIRFDFDEVKKYYQDRTNLLCPHYGYAIAHSRRIVMRSFLFLLAPIKHLEFKAFTEEGNLLTFASTYYSFNRDINKLLEDISTTSILYSKTHMDQLKDCLKLGKENIYSSLLASVVALMQKRTIPFTKPSEGLLSHLSDENFRTLLHFAQTYPIAIEKYISAHCPETYTDAVLEKLIEKARAIYYEMHVFSIPDWILERYIEEKHLSLTPTRGSLLVQKEFSFLDSKAEDVLKKYKDGVLVSAVSLWKPDNKQLIDLVSDLLISKTVSMTTNFLVQLGDSDTTLKNDPFLIFNIRKNSPLTRKLYKFQNAISKEPILYTKKISRKQETVVIGIGFRFTEDMNVETMKEVARKMISLVVCFEVPTFFYHPYLGLQAFTIERLVGMFAGHLEASPLINFNQTMQKYLIGWNSESNMEAYNFLNPQSCHFLFDVILSEEGEIPEVEVNVDDFAEYEKHSFVFITNLGKNIIAQAMWFQGTLPVIQIGRHRYLDRSKKIITLLEKRKEFFIQEVFSRPGYLKTILSHLDFAFAQLDEFDVITDLRLDYSHVKNRVYCSFNSPTNESHWGYLFRLQCKNNSYLTQEKGYLLIRRIINYYKIQKAEYTPINFMRASASGPKDIEEFCLVISLYPVSERDLSLMFNILKEHWKTLECDDLSTLTLFFQIYLTRCTHIHNMYKTPVVILMLNLYHDQLPINVITQCLLWCVANNQHVELLKLTSRIASLRACLLSPISVPEAKEALLVLEEIPSILATLSAKLPPDPPPPVSTMVATLPKPAIVSSAPTVTLPVASSIESKSEIKKEEKILWKGKELNHTTPLPFIAQYVLDRYYLKPYPGFQEKKVNRPLHGATHAIMTVLLVDLFKELFEKYFLAFLRDPVTGNDRLSEEEDKLLYLMALYHDSANTREDEGEKTDQTPHANQFYNDVILMGYDKTAAEKARVSMVNKEKKEDTSILKVILHDADCLEFLRCCHLKDYDMTRLDIYQLIMKHCPDKLPLFKEEITEITHYYKMFLNGMYAQPMLLYFENKQNNIKDIFYNKIKEGIAYNRLMRVIDPDKAFVFSELSSSLSSSLHRLYSLSLLILYSYKTADNIKVREAYFTTEEKKPIIESKQEEKEEDDGDEHNNALKRREKSRSIVPLPLQTVTASGSLEPFSGPFYLRGIRAGFKEEMKVWNDNLAILATEKISNLADLKLRYQNNPLASFRFRPATFIPDRIPVKTRWSHTLHILLKPEAVWYWAGFKKNAYSNFFSPKDFHFSDIIPARKIPSDSGYQNVYKLKPLTFRALEDKIIEMEAMRVGTKPSHCFRYFGSSALPANEVFLAHSDTLQKSITAIGICCNIKSPNWKVEIASVAAEIILLSPDLPPTMRYFFYIAQKGFAPLSLEQIGLIARGHIQSHLPHLGEVNGLNLFNKIPKNMPYKPILKSPQLSLTPVNDSTHPVVSLHSGIPSIQLNSTLYFDFYGAYRGRLKDCTQHTIAEINSLLSLFYWDLLIQFNITDIRVIFSMDEENKYIILFSFILRTSSVLDENTRSMINPLLDWMGYPYVVMKDKLRLQGKSTVERGMWFTFILGFPQALGRVHKTLLNKKKDLSLDLVHNSSWGDLPKEHQTFLNFCKIWENGLKGPNKNDAVILSLIDVIPRFIPIPTIAIVGFYEGAQLATSYNFSNEQVVTLLTNLLFLFYDLEREHTKNLLQLCLRMDTVVLMQLFSSPKLEKINLTGLVECKSLGNNFYSTLLYTQKSYKVEDAIRLMVRYNHLFSLSQLTDLLWTLIWSKEVDMKKLGLEGLTKIENRFREEKADSLRGRAMYSLIQSKRKEMEDKTESKSHDVATSTSSNLFQNPRKRGGSTGEENSPKNPRHLENTTETTTAASLSG